MLIRKFDRSQLESEPDRVLFKDIYPWEEIERTPFGASLAVVEPGGATMVHSHHPCETFLICQGQGTMSCDGISSPVASGDVIYLPPQSHHQLRNDSNSESLMFLSVFWDAPREGQSGASHPIMIWPSPPTPNGPLHLGHLSGPYLLADVLARFHKLQNRPAGWLLLCDDHQSYVELKADVEERSPSEVAAAYGNTIAQLMQNLDAKPDAVVAPHQNPAYQQAVQQSLLNLYRAGFVSPQERPMLWSEAAGRFLYDGHVAGTCPHCESPCRGFLCETCCMPNVPETLVDPKCIHSDTQAILKPQTVLVMNFEPWREALQEYHSELRLSPRLRALATRFLQLEKLEVIVSQPAQWGIELPAEIKLSGQRISPWFEVSLAGPALAGVQALAHCFGADNAFLYLIQDAAVSLALDPQRALPEALYSNEYLMLDDSKMSTSRGHSVDGEKTSDELPSDLLRFFLASVRPEEVDTNCPSQSMKPFLQGHWIDPLQNWLAALGQALTTESYSKAPEAEDWSEDHTDFQNLLESLRKQVGHAYSLGKLQNVSRSLMKLVEEASRFHLSQEALAGIPELADQRATALALELAAVQLLAQLSAPLTPKFATQLWKHLGQRGALYWPEAVEFVPSGQRVLAAAGLSSKRYFPQL